MNIVALLFHIITLLHSIFLFIFNSNWSLSFSFFFIDRALAQKPSSTVTFFAIIVSRSAFDSTEHTRRMHFMLLSVGVSALQFNVNAFLLSKSQEMTTR